MRERLAGALLLAALVSASVARADTPSSPEHDAIFKNGLEQYGKGNHQGAIATWENLLGTLGEERGYKVLYNLGLAYQAIGDVTHAIERYAAFVKQVGKREAVPAELANRAADAQGRLEQLQRTHGAIHVRPPTRGGLVLTRVGTSEPRAAGYTVWLAPGPHDLELYVGTDHVKRQSVAVEAGKTVDIDPTPPAEPAPPPTPAPVSTEPPRAARPLEERSSTWIWVGAGAALITTALPIATYVIASSTKDDATALGRGSSGYADEKSSFETWRTLHYVSYVIPVGLALATVAYAIFRPSARPSTTAGLAF